MWLGQGLLYRSVRALVFLSICHVLALSPQWVVLADVLMNYVDEGGIKFASTTLYLVHTKW